MKFRLGHYEITPGFRVPELHIETRFFLLDIDVNPKFPWGWCAALNIPGGEPPWLFHLHSSWNAWSGEPNRIDLHLGRLMIELSMPTWWRFRETGRVSVKAPVPANPERTVTHVDGYWHRTWPHTNWPPVWIGIKNKGG